MKVPDKIPAALRKLVEEQNSREQLCDDWLTPLQLLMNNGGAFAQESPHIPFPMAVYNRQGEIEMANDALLEETGLNAGDVDAGRANILNVDSTELMDAAMMVFHKQTSVVNGLKRPMDALMPYSSPASPRDYKSAILFPCAEDGPVLKGIVLFLPFSV